MSDITTILQSSIRVTGKVWLTVNEETGEKAPYVLQRVQKGVGNIITPMKHDMQLRQRVIPYDPQTAPQLAGRARISAATATYQGLTPEDREVYKLRSRYKRFTGFNLFVRQFCQEHPVSEFE